MNASNIQRSQGCRASAQPAETSTGGPSDLLFMRVPVNRVSVEEQHDPPGKGAAGVSTNPMQVKVEHLDRLATFAARMSHVACDATQLGQPLRRLPFTVMCSGGFGP